MKPWLKYLLYAIAAVVLTIWVMALVRNCGGNTDETHSNVTADTNDGITEEEINLESLIEEEEASFSEDQTDQSSTPAETTAPASSTQTDDATESPTSIVEESTEVNTEEEQPSQEATPPKTAPSSSSASTGEYMVIVGNFVVPTNAEKLARKLRGMGYDDAEVVVFDFSEYHTVIAGRYSSRSQAEKIRNALRRKGFRDAYVHKKKH